MRTPLARRKEVKSSYKKLIQYTPISNCVLWPQRLQEIYIAVRAAIATTMQYLLAEDVKHIQEAVQAQDNSDLDIREAPSRIARAAAEDVEQAFTDAR